MFGFVLKIEIQLVCVGMSAGMYMFSVASSAVGEQGRGEREKEGKENTLHGHTMHSLVYRLLWPPAVRCWEFVLGGRV